MNPVVGAALYFVLWWLSLLTVLPFFARPQPGPDEVSGWRGVPPQPRAWRVVLATTGVSVVAWLVVWLVVREGWLPLDGGWFIPRS